MNGMTNKLNIFVFSGSQRKLVYMLFKSISYSRILEPIVLGSIANIVINFIFKPLDPDFIFKEFIVAICFAIPITETNYFIGRKLERKFNWTANFIKRFFYQLFYLTVVLLLVINVIGNLYIWLIGDDFYSLNELLIINFSAFVIALLLTFFQWLIQFYKNWKNAELNFQNSNKELDEIKIELAKELHQIELQKGNSTLRINSEDIKYAKSEFGVVWVYYNPDKAIFNASLSSLLEELPKHHFFQANRNVILKRDFILSFSNATYGKIDIQLKANSNENESITISRLKASDFRKWYNSSSSKF